MSGKAYGVEADFLRLLKKYFLAIKRIYHIKEGVVLVSSFLIR